MAAWFALKGVFPFQPLSVETSLFLKFQDSFSDHGLAMSSLT